MSLACFHLDWREGIIVHTATKGTSLLSNVAMPDVCMTLYAKIVLFFYNKECLCLDRWLLILLRLRIKRPMLPRSLLRVPRWWSRCPLHGKHISVKAKYIVDQMFGVVQYYVLL